MAGGNQGAQANVLDALGTTVLPDIAKLSALPDAAKHMQFLQGLQQAITKYIQQQHQQAAQQAIQMGQQGAGGQPGQPAGGPPGMQPGGGAPGGPGMGGAPRANAPGGGPGMTGLALNPDDLNRVLAGPARAGNGGG